MTIQKNKILIVIFSIAILGFISMMPIFANADNGDTMGTMGTIMGAQHSDEDMLHSMGPVIGGRMLHAWVSLGAAVIIFFLALKYMTGGKLSQPIMLIGFGALGDAVLGLAMPPAQHMQWMWLAASIFSISVIIGILWMGKIFGVFQSSKEIS